MATLDIFNEDPFRVTGLTAAINQSPEGQQVPDLLDGLFEEEGVSTTTVFIERDHDGLALVPAGERGGPGEPVSGSQRDALPFRTLHLPTRATVYADEVQGIRAFGSESELETVEQLVARRLAKMRARLDATLRFHRIGAVTGKIYDADGSKVLLDAYNRFAITQQSLSFALATASTKIKGKITDAKRLAEDVIADSGVITGWLGVCGRNWMDAFSSHDNVEKAFDRWQDGSFLRTDNRNGFDFAGVSWREYYGKVGSISFIDPDTAYLIPLGVSGLFISRFAPADYMETVNTLGIPYYASMEMLPHNKGVELEAQSNPLNLCTRPRAIIKLTL